MLRRVKGGWVVVHCHGRDAGKWITKHPVSKAKALSIHRAIEASKARRGR